MKTVLGEGTTTKLMQVFFFMMMKLFSVFQYTEVVYIIVTTRIYHIVAFIQVPGAKNNFRISKSAQICFWYKYLMLLLI